MRSNDRRRFQRQAFLKGTRDVLWEKGQAIISIADRKVHVHDTGSEKGL